MERNVLVVSLELELSEVRGPKGEAGPLNNQSRRHGAGSLISLMIMYHNYPCNSSNVVPPLPSSLERWSLVVRNLKENQNPSHTLIRLQDHHGPTRRCGALL
jgi:hypothetical protein